ncbi:hypothetical protein ACWU4D_09740 [Vibrio sp. WJH972]
MSDIEAPFAIELVTHSTLKEITSSLDMVSSIDDITIANLRNDYPNLRFTFCYDSEMGSRDAYIECNGYDIHLVAHSTNGCSGLTERLESCTGVVIALHDE